MSACARCAAHEEKAPYHTTHRNAGRAKTYKRMSNVWCKMYVKCMVHTKSNVWYIPSQTYGTYQANRPPEQVMLAPGQVRALQMATYTLEGGAPEHALG